MSLNNPQGLINLAPEPKKIEIKSIGYKSKVFSFFKKMEEENSFLDQIIKEANTIGLKKETEDYKSFHQNKIEFENQRKFELKNGTSNDT